MARVANVASGGRILRNTGQYGHGLLSVLHQRVNSDQTTSLGRRNDFVPPRLSHLAKSGSASALLIQGGGVSRQNGAQLRGCDFWHPRQRAENGIPPSPLRFHPQILHQIIGACFTIRHQQLTGPVGDIPVGISQSLDQDRDDILRDVDLRQCFDSRIADILIFVLDCSLQFINGGLRCGADTTEGPGRAVANLRAVISSRLMRVDTA